MLRIKEALHSPKKAFISPLPHQKGFSLLEMLVVLAIIGVLASIAIPKYQEFVLQRKIDITAKALAQDLESARVYAQTNRLKTKICPTTPHELNMPLPKCEGQSTDTSFWDAWVVLILNESGAPNHVLSRSNLVAPSVLVSGTGESGRIISELGSPIDRIGFKMVIAAREPQGTKNKTVTLSPSGRVTHQ